MINKDLMNKDSEVFPEQSPIIILYINPAMCIDKNGKDNKHTIHIS